MKIAVYGAGYVGLVAAACLAKIGHQVVCTDIDRGKIAKLSAGIATIWEPGLEELLQDGIRSNRLRFTTDASAEPARSDAVILAVGTPSAADGNADTTVLWALIKELSPLLAAHTLVIVKSTVPVGTCEEIEDFLRQQNGGSPSSGGLVVHNPEFLRQGRAVRDFLEPQRIVIGASGKAARERLAQMYGPLDAPILYGTLREAEMIKYASNAFLAVKISYANMMADLCEACGASIEVVTSGMGMDGRIGPAFLRAGIGYGGSCFPKDLKALSAIASQAGMELPLITAAEQINNNRAEHLLKLMQNRLGSLQNTRIAVLGLSFKPQTDDLREAPSIKLCQQLSAQGAELNVYDPAARSFPVEGARQFQDVYSACRGCDAVVITTEWDIFMELNWKQLAAGLHRPVLFDGRNMYALETMRRVNAETGLEYHSIGRPSVLPEIGAAEITNTRSMRKGKTDPVSLAFVHN